MYSQKADDTQPMFGGVQKSKEEKDSDAELVKEYIQLYGSKDIAYSTFIDLGWKSIVTTDPATAIKKFNLAWLINPEQSDAYFGFSMAELVNGRLAKSYLYFESGQKFDKDKKSAFKYYLRSSDYFDKKKDTLALINALSEAVKLDSSSLTVFRKLAFYSNLKGMTESAIKAYSGAIRLNSHDSSFFYNRAFAYQKIKKHKEAIADFTKSIELSKKTNLNAYSNRGRSKFEMSDFVGAIEDFEFILTMTPKNGMMYRFIGSAKMLLNDGPGACEAWKKGKKLGDKQAEESYNLKCK